MVKYICKLLLSDRLKMSSSMNVNCVVVGDAAVGKTCMYITYKTTAFSGEYVPTAFDSMAFDVNYKDKLINLDLWDASGEDDFEQLRSISYQRADVCLIMFSIADTASFKNVSTKWHREVRDHCSGVPIVLLGTKSDLRHDKEAIEQLKSKGQAPITYGQGLSIAKKINAIKYVECSALSTIGLNDVFEAVVGAAISVQDTQIGAKARYKYNRNNIFISRCLNKASGY